MLMWRGECCAARALFCHPAAVEAHATVPKLCRCSTPSLPCHAAGLERLTRLQKLLLRGWLQAPLPQLAALTGVQALALELHCVRSLTFLAPLAPSLTSLRLAFTSTLRSNVHRAALAGLSALTALRTLECCNWTEINGTGRERALSLLCLWGPPSGWRGPKRLLGGLGGKQSGPERPAD